MPREILQLALGTEACEVTAHGLNLQGLAATTSNDNDGAALCDPWVTHTTTSKNLLIPRALLVDTLPQRYANPSQAGVAVDQDTNLVHGAWSGRVDTVDRHSQGWLWD